MFSEIRSSHKVLNDILGFHSRDETAMLVYKTMAKYRSSFAQ